MAIVLTGFWTCPNCAKVHTYSTHGTMAHCNCGAVVNQFTLAVERVEA